MSERVYVESPTRIDFSGGTLDLYPLYLLHQPLYVLNQSISIMTSAKIERDHLLTGPELISEDLGYHENYAMKRGVSKLPYHRDVVDYFDLQDQPIRFTSNSQAPLGSGLGGSSSVLISLVKAAAKYSELDLDKHQLQRIAQDIETKYLQVPTGTQDYIAALNQGMRVIHYKVGEIQIEQVDPAFAKLINDHIYLIYTGESHSSPRENWEMFKQRIDGSSSDKITAKFDKLQKLSAKMYESIVTNDIEEFLDLVDREWQIRKTLLTGMETPRMRAIFEELVQADLIKGMKGCGAAAGGSMIVIGKRGIAEKIQSIITKFNAELLPYDLV